ncbi:uncharacterized protein ACA1_254570 [Acanthamoeba castellanii str. Neff]|uniref:Major facilitator superfamily (MFS) profile domain-containing protein n=1 Tax=Acanthamoeba castellanii (strain ATCC 30010 / Neff) TaxID=1257118 RepID=L8HA35_ACACF|nr:uncharacterized protein ACA1_254570 [Acanthamoeba castellanii str. Neff]ELR22399.1 hypothetical protein ACA1_254570 [Acanthamoeba castellanii str. Neff]
MSLGFIVGPAAGGLLSARVGQMAPALVAALLYLVDFVIVFFFVDEQRQQHHPPAPTPPSLPTRDEKSERVKESNNDRTSDDEGGQEDTIVKEDTKATTGVVRQLKLVWEVFARPKVGRLLLIKFMIHLAMAMGRANFGLFMLERFGLGPEIGLAMGVAGSVNSIGDIVAPLLAGVLFNFVGLGGPRVISSLLIFIAFSLFVTLEILNVAIFANDR